MALSLARTFLPLLEKLKQDFSCSIQVNLLNYTHSNACNFFVVVQKGVPV